MVVNALTFDVEDYFHVSALAGTIDRASWDSIPRRVVRNTEALLDLLGEADVRATFFFLGWVADRHPELVRRVAAAGHEIACHGYSHKLVYDQDRAEFLAETRRAKSLLEDQVQRPVLGYRAASYSITRRSMWALDVLAETGFSYDSSIFPVRHDRYGIPDWSRWPGRISSGSGAGLIEFPLSTAQVGPYRLPVSGGGYFRIFPYAITSWAVRKVNADGRPFIFYLHPWEIDPGQPRVRTHLLSRFRHYTNLGACEARLRRLVSEFRFGTVIDVLKDIGLEPAPARVAA